jgi:hypothetical protein
MLLAAGTLKTSREKPKTGLHYKGKPYHCKDQRPLLIIVHEIDAIIKPAGNIQIEEHKKKHRPVNKPEIIQSAYNAQSCIRHCELLNCTGNTCGHPTEAYYIIQGLLTPYRVYLHL